MENKIHCFESLDATKERLVVENNQLAASLKALEDEMMCKKKEMDALQKVVSTVKANLQCLICQALELSFLVVTTMVVVILVLSIGYLIDRHVLIAEPIC